MKHYIQRLASSVGRFLHLGKFVNDDRSEFNKNSLKQRARMGRKVRCSDEKRWTTKGLQEILREKSTVNSPANKLCCYRRLHRGNIYRDTARVVERFLYQGRSLLGSNSFRLYEFRGNWIRQGAGCSAMKTSMSQFLVRIITLIFILVLIC